jgi:hypothetical protein
LPDVAKTVRVALIHTYGSDIDVVTRFFIRYSGTAPTNAQLDTFSGAVDSAWGTNLAAECNTLVTLTEVTATDLTTTSAAQGLFTTSDPGTRSGTLLPADACATAAYVIPRRYRGGHPRGYWPFGVTTDLASPQTWGSSFVAEFTGQLASFFAAVEAAGWAAAGTLSHVNVSYFLGFHVVTSPTTGRARNVPTLRGTPLVDTVSVVVGRTRIGSQRRRLG